MIKAKIGVNELLFITEPLDNWEAFSLGSSARVFHGVWKQTEEKSKTVAVKILRPDQLSYALPLFYEEIKTLCLLRDVPGVIKILAMGFIKSLQPIQMSRDLDQKNLRNINGDLQLYYPEEYKEFLGEVEQTISRNNKNALNQDWISPWTPFIILQKRPRKDNLLFLCDPAYAGGEHLDIKKGLQIIAQICEVLDTVYKRNIVYRDHKILHYYYNNSLSRVCILDWNAALAQTQGIHQIEVLMDIVEFSAHSMHYILLGRPASRVPKLESFNMGNNPEMPQKYMVDWGYDERCIPDSVKNLITKALNGKYQSYAEIKANIMDIVNSINKTEIISAPM